MGYCALKLGGTAETIDCLQTAAAREEQKETAQALLKKAGQMVQ
jgi:hypothetical protein